MLFFFRRDMRYSAVWFHTVRFPRTRLTLRQLKCSSSEVMDFDTLDVEGWVLTNVFRILLSSCGSSDKSESWHLWEF